MSTQAFDFAYDPADEAIAADLRELHQWPIPVPGYKFTDEHGGNGVICEIHESDAESKEQ